MKIGIIGCGYVGQAAALKWKQEGHEVSATTRNPEKAAFLRTLVDHVYVLNETDSLPSFINQQEVLLISVAPDKSSDYATTYLQTARVVAEGLSQPNKIKQILYTGSTSVYGDHQGEWVDEITKINPPNENAQMLYETEKLLLDCSSATLNVCVFRLGEIHGPGRDIAQRLRRMQNQVFAGTGESFTNLIHLDDIVSALNFALIHQLNGIYNLCNDVHVSRRQLYERLCLQENLPPIQWDPTKINQHSGNKRVSNQKLKSAGFVFT